MHLPEGEKRRTLHIAFVTTESPYADRGACGIASYLRALIPAIVDAGHQVTVFANANEERDFTAEQGRVSVHHFRLPALHWYAAKVPLIRSFAPLPVRQVEWSLAFYRRVAAVAARTKIDVIESTEAGSLFLGRIAPLVIRLHGSERIFREQSGLPLSCSVRWNDRLESYSCKHAAVISAPSQFQAGEFTSHRRWSRDRVRVIPNPISKELLNASLQFQRNGNTERLVLYTGRLAPVKGIDTLLEATRIVRGHDPSVTFVLAGPWQMPQSPEHYGLELNRESEDGILWVGPQNQSEISEWYKRAALFVMPSYSESFGISAVEAIAFGLPVVAAETGGLAEIVGKNGSALLVPKRDPLALAGAINRLMAAPAEEINNGAESRSVVQKFHPKRVAAQAIETYEAARNRSSRNTLRRPVGPVTAGGKARILIFSSSYLPVVGGVQTVVHNLAKHLTLNGHQVRVVTNRYPLSLPSSETIEGVSVERLLLLHPQSDQLRRGRPDLFVASLFYYPQNYRRLRKTLKEFRPQVINIHFADDQIPLVLKLRSEFDFRLVVSLHGHDVERAVNAHLMGNGAHKPGASQYALRQLRAILTQADAITAVSGNLLNKATQIESTISDKSHVINNGIDPKRFDDRRSYQHSRPYILGLGRLTHSKGFDLLIQAFAECDSQDKPDLIIAGSGEERDALHAQVARLGLTERIHFFGEASPEEVVQLLNGCLIVAVPSRSETFGIVALEALAAGKPVLATRTGGLEEFLLQFEKQDVMAAASPAKRRVILVDATVQEISEGLKRMFAISEGELTLPDNYHLPTKYNWTHVARSYEQVLLGQQQMGN